MVIIEEQSCEAECGKVVDVVFVSHLDEPQLSVVTRFFEGTDMTVSTSDSYG